MVILKWLLFSQLFCLLKLYELKNYMIFDFDELIEDGDSLLGTEITVFSWLCLLYKICLVWFTLSAMCKFISGVRFTLHAKEDSVDEFIK